MLFFLLGIVSALSYALQNTLMVRHFRAIDTLCAVSYRGIALGITMLPLLFFVPAADFASSLAQPQAVLAASLCALGGNWCSAASYRRLPVALSAAIATSFTTLGALAVSFTLLGERISAAQAVFICAIVAMIGALGVLRSQPAGSGTPRLLAGAAFSAGGGLFMAFALFLIGSASRSGNPLLTAYLWEFTIGLLGMLAVYLRSISGIGCVEILSGTAFRRLMVNSSPTLFGTGCFAVATTLGPMAVAAAVLSTTFVASSVLARIFYREILTGIEWGLIAAVCAALIGLQLSG